MSEEIRVGTGGRHSGREVALQVLYAVDLACDPAEFDVSNAASQDERAQAAPACEHAGTPTPGGPHMSEGTAGIFDRVTQNFSVPRSAIEFARVLVAGVVEQGEALDALLSAHARNWRVTRMAVVDRNVLRLAIYELRDTETPVAVVIDEAVDLARRFGSDSSPSFVNGVLDAIARELRAA